MRPAMRIGLAACLAFGVGFGIRVGTSPGGPGAVQQEPDSADRADSREALSVEDMLRVDLSAPVRHTAIQRVLRSGIVDQDSVVQWAMEQSSRPEHHLARTLIRDLPAGAVSRGALKHLLAHPLELNAASLVECLDAEDLATLGDAALMNGVPFHYTTLRSLVRRSLCKDRSTQVMHALRESDSRVVRSGDVFRLACEAASSIPHGSDEQQLWRQISEALTARDTEVARLWVRRVVQFLGQPAIQEWCRAFRVR